MKTVIDINCNRSKGLIEQRNNLREFQNVYILRDILI